MFVHCWLALAAGIGAIMINESFYIYRNSYFEEVNDSSNDTVPVNQRDSLDSQILLEAQRIFRVVITCFSVGVRPFVDYSIIQLSLIFSCYQRHLRQKIERWSLVDLGTKERLRQTYLDVQTLVRVNLAYLSVLTIPLILTYSFENRTQTKSSRL